MGEKNKQNYALPIAVMFLLFFSIAFVTNLAGSMGVVVTNQFGASKALSQLGPLVNFIAYACMGIPGGIILKRKGYKFTAITAIIIGLAGLGVQFASGYAESFLVYVIGAFIAGFSLCMLNIVVNPMLNTLGGGGNRGNKLIQCGGSCYSFGGTISSYLVGFLIGQSISDATVQKTVPVMITAMAIFVFALIVIAFTDIPEPHMETPEEKAARKSGQTDRDSYGPLSFRHFVLGAIAIFFSTGIEVSIPNTANVYFSGLSFVGPALTGTYIGVFYICMFIGRLSGAAFGSNISSKKMLSFAALFTIVLIVCAICVPESVRVTFGKSSVPASLLFLVLCGLCTSVLWGSIFNLAAEGLGKYTATASGIFMALVCGGGVIPFIQNAVADHVGSINSYWVLVPCLAYLIFYALIGSKNVNKDIPTE